MMEYEKLKRELEIHQMLLENSEYSNKVLTWISVGLSLIVIIMAI
jgi:hypothetical protein